MQVEDPASDRREYERARVVLDIHFDGADLIGIANTRDMSLGGLYMNTRAHLPEGAILQIRVPFGATREAVLTAEVVYVNPGVGVGLRFKDVSDKARLVLERELAQS